MKKILIIIFFTGFAASFYFYKQNYLQNQYIIEQRLMMDTLISLKIPASQNSDKIFKLFFSEFERIELKYSKSNINSIIYKINHRQINSIEIDGETTELLKQCLKYYNDTLGYFDVSMYSLGQFWNFNSEDDSGFPEKQKKSESVFKYSGSDKIKIIGSRIIFENSEIKIDLGAIAKGYAIDRVRQILKEQKIVSGLINAGGEIYAIGEKKKKSIGI